jgi:triphosphatase
MSEPEREIELKFLLDQAAVDAVLAALPAVEAPTVKSLVATYYDTADQSLSKAGFGLRVRRSGKVRTQTLKSAAGADGGRDEWEWLVKTDTPDLALLLDTPAPVTAETMLEPQFTVRSKRTIRLVEEAGAWIELVVDDAEVSAGDRSEAFLELELELKSGPAEALFSLARRLREVAPLRTSFVTKAERGYRLAAGGVRRPGRRDVGLGASPTTAEAFQAIAAAGLAHMCASAESLRQTPGPEGVHQLRVAARRLRAALKVFKDVVAGPEVDRLKGELKWIAREMDDARNIDVFIADVWRPAARDQHELPGMAEFGRALLTAQTVAYVRAGVAIEDRRFQAATLDLLAWIMAGDWLKTEATAEARDEPAAAFAARVLGRHRKKILKRGKDLAALDAETRHGLRIRAKVLRYASEDLGPLEGDHPRRAERFAEALKDMQDALGVLNDLAFSDDLAHRIAVEAGSADAAWAAGRLAGGSARDEKKLLKQAQKAFDAFAATKPFW